MRLQKKMKYLLWWDSDTQRADGHYAALQREIWAADNRIKFSTMRVVEMESVVKITTKMEVTIIHLEHTGDATQNVWLVDIFQITHM